MKQALMFMMVVLLAFGANAQSKKKMDKLVAKFSDELCECFQSYEIETEEEYDEIGQKCVLSAVYNNYSTIKKYDILDFNDPTSSMKFLRFMENVGIHMTFSCETFFDLLMKFDNLEDGEQDKFAFPFSR
jgi:hypothetical protein